MFCKSLNWDLAPAQADDVLGTAFSDATGLMLRGAVEQQLLTALAAGIARFEAEVAPGIAADAQPDRSLDDLRLATPALRPVGCWWSGCGNLSGASEAGLRTQLCSGCDTARFCSPACHKAAWRAGHRGACKRLRARA